MSELPPNCPMKKSDYAHYCPSPTMGTMSYEQAGTCSKQDSCTKLVKDFKEMKVPTTSSIKSLKWLVDVARFELAIGTVWRYCITTLLYIQLEHGVRFELTKNWFAISHIRPLCHPCISGAPRWIWTIDFSIPMRYFTNYKLWEHLGWLTGNDPVLQLSQSWVLPLHYRHHKNNRIVFVARHPKLACWLLNRS